MRITERDLRILARVRDLRACDSQSLADLFPTPEALRQRLWRLVCNSYLVVHRTGNHRVYSLGRAGLRVLGLRVREVRIASAAVPQYVIYSHVRRLLQSEGYSLDGEMLFGRTRVLRARIDGRNIAVAVSARQSSMRGPRSMIVRLQRLVNPFDPVFDQVIIFCPPHHVQPRTLPAPYRERVLIRPLPKGAKVDFLV